MNRRLGVVLAIVAMTVIGCNPGALGGPTLMPTAIPLDKDPASGDSLPPTWTLTPIPLSSPSGTPRGTSTSSPPTATKTPWPSVTSTSTILPPTSTPTPEPSQTPTGVPTLPPSANLLPNPSFEDGWYNLYGLPEIQVANRWTLEWDEGANTLDPDPWNVFVRPESRVLPRNFLPAREHELFIWDGDHTVKVFKGQGAISFRLVTTVYLTPGTYLLEINVFPDLVVGYTPEGKKIWAPDPLSGEFRFIAADAGSGWLYPTFGIKNTYSYPFSVASARVITLGVAFRGRWAIENNGWFMDDWSLTRISE